MNIVQVSWALGHHSAAFTLDTYAHLLDGEQASALDLTVVLPAPIRLRPVAERDAAMRRFFETNEIIDPQTGEPWRPQELPPDPAPTMRATSREGNTGATQALLDRLASGVDVSQSVEIRPQERHSRPSYGRSRTRRGRRRAVR